MTGLQNWCGLVFPLSLGCPFNLRELLGVGVTARVCLVFAIHLFLEFRLSGCRILAVNKISINETKQYVIDAGDLVTNSHVL